MAMNKQTFNNVILVVSGLLCLAVGSKEKLIRVPLLTPAGIPVLVSCNKLEMNCMNS